MSLETRPLSPGARFGREVVGLTPDRLREPDTRAELRDLWVQEGVLVFRDVEGGSQTQLDLSRCFGDLERHPLGGWVEGFEELIHIDYDPATGTAYNVDGEGRGGWLPWHSDLVYSPEINHGGILRAIRVPPEGGQTGFLDQISAYDDLPQDIKDRIDDLEVIYRLDLNAANQKFGRFHDVEALVIPPNLQAILDTQETRFGPVLHPMVYSQPETGRKVLNVSPWFATGIQGMETPEGDALLETVIRHCVREDRAYFHAWRDGDMVLWDNWRTLHCAAGVPVDTTRLMHRSTIAGDYKLGRALGAPHLEAAMSV